VLDCAEALAFSTIVARADGCALCDVSCAVAILADTSKMAPVAAEAKTDVISTLLA
jgi:hypothetical protein